MECDLMDDSSSSGAQALRISSVQSNNGKRSRPFWIPQFKPALMQLTAVASDGLVTVSCAQLASPWTHSSGSSEGGSGNGRQPIKAGISLERHSGSHGLGMANAGVL